MTHLTSFFALSVLFALVGGCVGEITDGSIPGARPPLDVPVDPVLDDLEQEWLDELSDAEDFQPDSEAWGRAEEAGLEGDAGEVVPDATSAATPEQLAFKTGRRLGVYFVDGTAQTRPREGYMGTTVWESYKDADATRRAIGGTVTMARYFGNTTTAFGCRGCEGLYQSILAHMCQDLRNGTIDDIAVVGYSRGSAMGTGAAMAAQFCSGVPSRHRLVWVGALDNVRTHLHDNYSHRGVIRTPNVVVDHIYKSPSYQGVGWPGGYFTSHHFSAGAPGVQIRNRPVAGHLQGSWNGVVLGVDHNLFAFPWIHPAMSALLRASGNAFAQNHGYSPIFRGGAPDVACADGVITRFGGHSDRDFDNAQVGRVYGRTDARLSTYSGHRNLTSNCRQSGNESIYVFTATEDGTYEFSTESDRANGETQFDTVLSFRSSCGGPELACNDDVNGTLQSRLSRTMSEGETILVRVAGYGSGRGGRFILTVRRSR